MNLFKKQYNEKILQNLYAEKWWATQMKDLAGIQRIESAIEQHKAMALKDEEEERMEALRGECGLTSKAPSR